MVLAVALTTPAAAAQEATGGAEPDTSQDAEGPLRYGAFVLVENSGEDGPSTALLVGPDVNSSLNDGARLFLRCRGEQREIFIAHTGKILGNAEQGAGGRTRFDRLQWSDLIQWGASGDGTAAFLPPRRLSEFVARARESDVLEVQLVTPTGVTRGFRFELDGFAEGLGRLSCFQS